MLAHPSFLKLCEQLGHANPEQRLEPGMKIARGFADLGFEEFLLLPGSKLLALYSGQVTQFQEEHRTFFFPVPTADELIAHITTLNWDIDTLTYEDQRTWKLSLSEATTKATKAAEGGTLEECLARGLLSIVNSGAI